MFLGVELKPSRKSVLTFLCLVLVLHTSVCLPVFLKSDRQVQPLPFSSTYPELGDYLEGDILTVNNEKPKAGMYNAVLDDSLLWEGYVPYSLDGDFTDDEVAAILEAISEIEGNSCVRFTEYDGEDDYLSITDGDGCASFVGRTGGQQSLVLELGACFTTGTIIHELMHALGFFHEQNRWDRDSYVTIVWDNIIEGYEGNFIMNPTDDTTDLGLEYDYTSIMHYPAYSFPIDPSQPTIIPLDSSAVIGQRDGLSSLDIQGINTLYQCD